MNNTPILIPSPINPGDVGLNSFIISIVTTLIVSGILYFIFWACVDVHKLTGDRLWCGLFMFSLMLLIVCIIIFAILGTTIYLEFWYMFLWLILFIILFVFFYIIYKCYYQCFGQYKIGNDIIYT